MTKAAGDGGANAASKTQPHSASVSAFLDAVPDARRREDAKSVAELMATLTGEPPVMWGPSMVGFGRYAYTYDSGRSGHSFLTGFSPRKSELVIYITPGLEGFGEALSRLGPHKTGASCLYIKSLAALDRAILSEIIAQSVAIMRARYG